MHYVTSKFRKLMSAGLIALELLHAPLASAFADPSEDPGVLNRILNIVKAPEPAQPAPVTPTQSSAPARKPVKPRVAPAKLSDGDGDGIMDDLEREAYVKGESRPEDAESIGRHTVNEDQPLYSGPGLSTQPIGQVKKGEVFSVVLPGQKYSRVRFSDGRLGLIETAKITSASLSPEEDDEREQIAPTPQRPRDKKKLEANCANCDRHVPMPKAIDDKKIGGLAKVSKKLNEDLARQKKEKEKSGPPRTNVPDIVDDLKDMAGGRQKRLIAAAHRRAMECRVPASYLQRRRGTRPICGNTSKGMCYRAVKQALMDAGIMKYYLPGSSAKDAHYRGHLQRAGMKNIMPAMRSKMGGNLQRLAKEAPAGAVLVYDGGGHGHGHIEIKAQKNEYCSDFCRGYPVNVRNARRLIGIYVP